MGTMGAFYPGTVKLILDLNFFYITFLSGMKVNPLDLSPNYAGSLMATTNGIGALTGILGYFNNLIACNPRIHQLFLICRPYLVGVITGDSTIAQWRIVFWIAFVVFNVTNIVYVIWASGEVQPWNDGYLVKNVDDSASTSENNYDSPSRQIEQLKSDSLK